MKIIRLHRSFEKAFKKRVIPNKKLVNQYEKRVRLFVAGERGYPLDDHALAGNMIGKRAFSITPDIRVVYEETDSKIVFLDIGSHNQVY